MTLDRRLRNDTRQDPIARERLTTVDEAESLADVYRAKWDLGDQPIASATTLLEDRGWYVVGIPDDPHVDGLAGYVEETGRPFVGSRRAEAVDRVRINLLHEAGHALFEAADAKLEEKCAFRFAASLLLPAERVCAEIGERRSSLDLDELLFVKMKYGISLQAITFRLKDLGVISESYYRLLFTYYSRNNFRFEEPGSDELRFQEEPLALRSKVHRALAEGLVTEAEVLRIVPDLQLRRDRLRSISSASIKELMSKSRAERDEVLGMAAESAASYYEDPDVNLPDRSEPYHDDPPSR